MIGRVINYTLIVGF